MDHRAKLKRARDHLDSLETAIDQFMDSEPYVPIVKYNRAENGYYAILDQVSQLPPDWSLIIGDAIHNLRSSLDALVYALTKKALGHDLTDDETRELQFPIVKDLKDFKGEFMRRIPKLGRREWAEIFWVQPFWHTDPTLTDHPKSSALAMLRDLSNVDKHRHLLIAAAAATSSSIELTGPGITPGTTIQGYVGPLEVDTILARWKFVNGTTPTRPLDESKVKAEGKLALDVQFTKTGPGQGASVLALLRNTARWFDDTVFPPLESILNGP